jgi:transaldolase/glucose-6-phosphate isomerase
VNPLHLLHEQGQAIWLDFLARRFVVEGGLKRLVQDDDVTGVTSNPSIFKKAIAGSSDYDSSLNAVVKDADCDVMALYESLAVADIQTAADVLLPVYRATNRADGFVSLEVSPYLAHDTAATIAEARRLWKEVGRENVMIKVPATQAGIPAIRQLLGEGININITLLFARAAYREVVEAYLSGLETFLAGGGDATSLSSVASFFVSRIDVAVDRLIEEQLKKMPAGADADSLGALRGKIAIANAKLAYQDYKRLFAGPRWQNLRDKGARVQRLLWASTSTKNPAYRDVLYVEELIGADTVNTMPPETVDAFRDHGKVRASLEENVAAADAALTALARFGISLDAVTTKLTEEGVRLFADAFDDLLAAVGNKRAAQLGPALNRQTAHLTPEMDQAVTAALEDWRKGGLVRRLWRRDASLWTGADEAKWLGWLDIAAEQRGTIDHLTKIAADAKANRFTHAVLLGMGGSSLGAEVFATTFGAQAGYPKLLVLDSTDPAEIKSIEDAVDLKHTLFIVSSKSGSTLEPNILKDYFFDRAEAAAGKGKAGAHFIAITDPGSKLLAAATAEQFRQICLGKAEIGGRYSVLSDFGLVPAAVMGVDVTGLLDATSKMIYSCGPHVPPVENPGVRLGAILGALGRQGRDKITIVASPAIADIGAWLEQLLAESTGKLGKGLIPLEGETLGAPERYGKDRLFAYLRLEEQPDQAQDAAIAALEKAGQPVVRIALANRLAIGQEFFRWEMATAVAGAIIGINPFDQPDVEASKVKTRELMTAYESAGSLPVVRPLFEDGGIGVYADAENAKALKLGGGATLVDALRAHFARAKEGDYCGLLAYIARNPQHQKILQEIRLAIRDAKHVATCVGFGPRFLHSTGQAYKGGPNSGVFLQITASRALDIPVPGRKYSFGAVIDATAEGDFAVLNERGRRAMRVNLGANAGADLARLRDAVRAALG